MNEHRGAEAMTLRHRVINSLRGATNLEPMELGTTAEAILSDLDANGFAIVPREPSAEVVRAGKFSSQRTATGPWKTSFDVGREKWQAMLNASEEEK